MSTLSVRAITWTPPLGLLRPTFVPTAGDTEQVTMVGVNVFEDSTFIVLAPIAEDVAGGDYLGGVWIVKADIVTNLAIASASFDADDMPRQVEWKNPTSWRHPEVGTPVTQVNMVAVGRPTLESDDVLVMEPFDLAGVVEEPVAIAVPTSVQTSNAEVGVPVA